MKVIRSKNIYTKRHNKLKLVVFFALAAVCLVAAGWFVAGPMMDMLSQAPQSQSAQSQVSSIASDANSQGSESSASSQTSSNSSTNTAGDWLKSTAVATMPVEQLKNPQGISDYLNTVKTQTGATPNTLIVDVKAAGGTLAYTTAYPGAESASSADLSLEQMAANVKTIQSAGVKLIARVHCFDDALAGKFVEGAKVSLEGNSGYTWLDDSLSNGGKGWLNAYSTTAQDYLVSIIKEVAGAGFDGVLLDSVQLPVGYGLKKADYGTNAATQTAQQALTDFINKAIAAVPSTPVLLNTTARADFDGELTPYGGVSPLTYSLSGLAGYTITLNAPAMPRKQSPVVLTEEQKAAYTTAMSALTNELPVIPLTLG